MGKVARRGQKRPPITCEGCDRVIQHSAVLGWVADAGEVNERLYCNGTAKGGNERHRPPPDMVEVRLGCATLPDANGKG